MNRSKARPVLAIDLGGTKIIAALVSPDGRMIARERSATQAAEGPSAVIDRLFSAIDHILKWNKLGLSDLHGISLAAAGSMDLDAGVITLSPNLPGWRDIPLMAIVHDKYRIDTFLLNDASAAALGEHRFGVGKGTKDLILLTLGTGIGGGIIINGELYNGICGSGGEIGHMTIDVNGPRCPCGNTGCLEVLASGTAISRDAIGRVTRGEKSSLVEMVGGKVDDISAEKVGSAARAGDRLSLDVIATAAAYLGVGLVNLTNIFNPEMVVLGGGVAKLGDLLLEPARRLVRERAFPLSAKTVRVVTTKLGNDAGVYGAATFALRGRS